MKRASGSPASSQVHVTKAPRVELENGGRDKLCYKFLAPTLLVATIMGPKGKNIKDLQNATSTHIKISERGQNYVATNSRLATVLGNSTDDLAATVELIVGHLTECIEKATPQADMSEICPSSQADGMLLVMIVPKQIRGAIIGPAGSQVSELREQSGCKIKLEEGLAQDSKVRIEGTAEGIQKVVHSIILKLAEECEEEWYQQYVSERSSMSEKVFNTNGNQQQAPRLPLWPQQQGQGSIQAPRRNVQGPPGIVTSARRDRNHEYGHSSLLNPVIGLGGRLEANADMSPNWPNLNMIIERVTNDVTREQGISSIQIPIPVEFKGALIGIKGKCIKEILHESTCTSLNITDNADSNTCTVTVEGSVMACTAAYLLVMSRYCNRNHPENGGRRPLAVGARDPFSAPTGHGKNQGKHQGAHVPHGKRPSNKTQTVGSKTSSDAVRANYELYQIPSEE